MPGTCDHCQQQPATYTERVEYVSLDQKTRLHTKRMRRVCGGCATDIVNHLPSGASMVAVVDSVRQYVIEPSDAAWKEVERHAQPFVNMGSQERLPL